ncbi:MAG: hypothetical protein IKG22_08600 [Atopobiaceae bacterium]|nr:hypothetical protein [Atopobiaceae bacterium]
MKKYEPKSLVAASRYQHYCPTLPADVQTDVYARMGELIEEDRAYCDKGNYAHMAQILTSIALYEVLQEHGASEKETYRAVSEEMWGFLDPSSMQKLAKKGFFLPLMKRLVPFGFKHGSGAGWRYTWHTDDPSDQFHFECNECLYATILGPRSLMKLAPCAATRILSITAICPTPTSFAHRPSAKVATIATFSSCGTTPTPAIAGSAPRACRRGGAACR